jgi:hypothetical protein
MCQLGGARCVTLLVLFAIMKFYFNPQEKKIYYTPATFWSELHSIPTMIHDATEAEQ